MRVKLTDRFIRSVEPDPARKTDYFDTDRKSPTGFLLYVTPGGHKAFALSYQDANGRTRRYTIGSSGAYRLAEARSRAAEMRRAVDAGADPLAERKASRGAETVADLWERFAAGELLRRAPGTQSDYRSLYNMHIKPTLGSLKVVAVTRADVEKLFRALTTKGHATRANRMRAVLSILFGQGVADGLRPDNPVRFIRLNREDPRQRYLNDDELGRLLDSLDRHRDAMPDSVDIITLALLTGSRRGEILGAEWSEFEGLDGDRPTWSKPASRTKQRRASRVPLSAEAAAILRRRRADPVRQLRGVFAYGDTRPGQARLERDWEVIRQDAGLTAFRFHDLRHSAASLLVGEGLSLPMIGALLGHARSSTTSRYAHLADAPLRAATELLAGKVRR